MHQKIHTYLSQSESVSIWGRRNKIKSFSNLIRKWKLEEKWKARSSALKLAYSTAFLAGNQIYSGLLQNSFCTLYIVQSNFTMKQWGQTSAAATNDDDDDYSSATIWAKMSTHRNFNCLVLASSNNGRTKQSKAKQIRKTAFGCVMIFSLSI